MKPIILMALGFLQVVLLCACTPRSADHGWKFAEEAPTALHRETEVTVSIVPDPVMKYDGMCEKLRTGSWEQGVEELLHMYVTQAALLRPSEASGSNGVLEGDQGTGAVVSSREPRCDPWLDSVTGMVSQRTGFFSSLVPERRMGGVIDALQEDQTMGGMLSKAYVSLWGPPQGQAPIPVLIVQRSSGLEQGMAQVVGAGLITQITDTTSQMRILESTREIFPGDLFFQLQVRAEVLPMEGDLLPLGPETEE
ncbi:hypothetical protein [Desulfonatronum sp. SC1]|uniref:hypothetical protein n=1 Tax=Desulfonatronum sp. SC1 TaxID=2109626 RepID=UPI000D2FB0D3|nr:hypothetical protein [Desulfonatronum sp. SC1]PTN31650.1 hypothetical protein C6366_17795 [Desulfonatronum sp. SC1]